MRYQTARALQYFQNKGDKAIQPTDIMMFDDEVEAITKEKEAKKVISPEKSKKLDEAYARYLKSKSNGV